MTFTGGFALPPLMARDTRQVGSIAALLLTVGYAIGFVGPQVGGLLVDATGDPASPFWVVVAAALALIPVGLTLPRRS
jgi:cyanate permease